MRSAFAFALAAVCSLATAEMLLEKSLENVEMDSRINIVDEPQKKQETAGPSKEDDIITINLDSVSNEFQSTLEQTGIPLKAGGQIRFSVGGNPTTGF